MKKSMIVFLMIFVLSLSFTVNGAEEPITFKLAYPVPENSFFGQAYNIFAETLEEESNGEIVVEQYPSGSLINDQEVFKSLRRGTCDLAHFMGTYMSPYMKELTPLNIPGMFPPEKYVESDKAIRTKLTEIFAKYNMKYLASSTLGGHVFATTDQMIKSPVDTNGKTIRISGKWVGEAVKLWGGTPVTIPLSDVSVSLQRGNMDSVYTSWVMVGALKLYETAPYVTFAGHDMFCGIVMNLDAWNKLNKEQKRAVEIARDKYIEYNASAVLREREKTIEKIIEDGGEVYSLSEEEHEAFNELSFQLLDETLEIAGPKGEELVEILNKVRNSEQ